MIYNASMHAWDTENQTNHRYRRTSLQVANHTEQKTIKVKAFYTTLYRLTTRNTRCNDDGGKRLHSLA